jgi:hypothetical protein
MLFLILNLAASRPLGLICFKLNPFAVIGRYGLISSGEVNLSEWSRVLESFTEYIQKKNRAENQSRMKCPLSAAKMVEGTTNLVFNLREEQRTIVVSRCPGIDLRSVWGGIRPIGKRSQSGKPGFNS